MRQDKCFELRKAQLRWNRLPALTSSHSGHPENWTIAYPVSEAENPGLQRLADKFACLEKPATSSRINTRLPSCSASQFGSQQWFSQRAELPPRAPSITYAPSSPKKNVWPSSALLR